MSFLSENKFFVGAVGIALSSAAVGYALARYRQQKPEKKYEYKVGGIVVPKAAADYFMEYGIREPLPLQKLREVRVCFHYSETGHAFQPRIKFDCITDFIIRLNAPINSKLQHPPPPRANPGHLTVHRARGGGNLNVGLERWGI